MIFSLGTVAEEAVRKKTAFSQFADVGTENGGKQLVSQPWFSSCPIFVVTYLPLMQDVEFEYANEQICLGAAIGALWAN